MKTMKTLFCLLSLLMLSLATGCSSDEPKPDPADAFAGTYVKTNRNNGPDQVTLEKAAGGQYFLLLQGARVPVQWNASYNAFTAEKLCTSGVIELTFGQKTGGWYLDVLMSRSGNCQNPDPADRYNAQGDYSRSN